VSVTKDQIPNLARVSIDEMALLKIYRVCSSSQQRDIYELCITLATRTISEAPKAKVILLADPKRKFR
jgi:hypothetical protein